MVPVVDRCGEVEFGPVIGGVEPSPIHCRRPKSHGTIIVTDSHSFFKTTVLRVFTDADLERNREVERRFVFEA